MINVVGAAQPVAPTVPTQPVSPVPTVTATITPGTIAPATGSTSAGPSAVPLLPPEATTAEFAPISPKKPANRKKIQFLVAGILLVVLLVGGFVGLELSKTQQDVRQQAAGTIPKSCNTNADCPVNYTCVQPPMPTCPAGKACPEIMPGKQCKPKTGTASPTPTKKAGAVSPTPTKGAGAPTCTSAGPPGNPSINANAVNYAVYAYGVKNATEVSFRVWSTNKGQDDLVAYAGVDKGDGTWKAIIPFSAHPDQGAFGVNVWMNKNVLCGNANFVRGAAPTISPAVSPSINPSGEAGITPSVTAEAEAGVTPNPTDVLLAGALTGTPTVTPNQNAEKSSNTEAPTTQPTVAPTDAPSENNLGAPAATATPVVTPTTASGAGSNNSNADALAAAGTNGTNPSPTAGLVQTTLNCNETCTSSTNCRNKSHVCYQGTCRLEENPEDASCRLPSGGTQIALNPTQASRTYTAAASPSGTPLVSGPSDWILYLQVGAGLLGLGALALLFF